MGSGAVIVGSSSAKQLLALYNTTVSILRIYIIIYSCYRTSSFKIAVETQSVATGEKQPLGTYKALFRLCSAEITPRSLQFDFQLQMQ
jgi:hypothetical protein